MYLYIIFYCNISPQSFSACSSTVRCSALTNNEIQPYGFDISGKCDCRPWALSSPSLRSLLCWNMHDSFLKNLNLFQTRKSDPSLARDTCSRTTSVSRAWGFCHRLANGVISLLLFPPLSALLPDSVTQQSATQQTGKPVPTWSCHFSVSSSAESASQDVQTGVKVPGNHKGNRVDIVTGTIYLIQFVVEQRLYLSADY